MITLLVVVDLFIIVAGQHYTCPSNTDCIQDCTTTSCVNYVIQAANAANLQVTCANGYCSGIQISCPYDTTATCSVECQNNNACKDAIINYPQPQNVKLKCSGSSACNGLQLLGPETFSDTTVISNATIQCLGESTCNNAIFDLNYVHFVDISCQYTSSTTASCSSTNIYTRYASNTRINCYYYDCSNLYIDATSITNELILDCNGASACGSSTTVHVEDANHFTLQCESSSSSCSSVAIYPNQDNYHRNEITCAGTGCHGVYVHVDDDYVLDYVDFTATTTDIGSVSFICSSRGTSKLFYNDTTQQFECDVKRCCPWVYGDIVCDGNNENHGDCTINCVDLYGIHGCANRVIDAVNATNLNVICNSTSAIYGGCEGAVIFCPRNMVHKYGGNYLQCNMECIDPKSCWAAEISSYDNDEVNILCNNNLSCTFLTLYGTNTKQSNIQCSSREYFERYADIIGIEYPYHDSYEYSSSFESGMDGWECETNTQYGNCGTTSATSEYGASLRVYSSYSSNAGEYYAYAHKTFDMKWASNIKLDCYVEHGITNVHYYSRRAFVYIEYSCGSGWTRLEGFCHADNGYSYLSYECPYTDDGYYTKIHRTYSLPSQCNYNSAVQIRFYASGLTNTASMYVSDVTVIGASDIYMGSCCDMDIDAKQQNEFNLICDGTIACVNNTINVQNADHVTTTMMGIQSDIKSVINAQDTDIFNINCGSRYSAHFVDACWNTVFYGNDHANGLNCESYGCNTLNIYSANGISDWNITINGCMESQNMQNSISWWNILCGDDYTSPTKAQFNGNTCDTNNCGCDLLTTDNNSIQSSYDEIQNCELEKPDIICEGDGKDCNIDCKNCSDTAITGAASKSLNVLCDDSCSKSLIYCPFNNKCKVQCDVQENVCFYTEIYVGINQDLVIECKGNDSCNFVQIYANKSRNIDIYCLNYMSCNNMKIYAFDLNQSINIYCTSLYSCNDNTIYGSHSQDITLNCYLNYSCNNMVIDGSNINNLTLNCLTNYACNYLSLYVNHSEIANIKCYSYNSKNEPSCNHLSLYGSHISSYIDWECFGDYACSHNELHAEYSNSIDLMAYGDRALYYGHVFAAHATTYNVSCLSSDHDMFTCFSSTMQGPSKDITYPYAKNAYLNCYGFGCYSLNLDSDSGFDDWIIYFNGCNICNNVTSCFDYWYLTCSDLETLDDHWKLNYYYGDSCKIMTSDDCKCVSYIDILSQQFLNDYALNPSYCDFKVPYLTFTEDPTTNPTVSPTNPPSNNPSNAPTYNPTKYPSNVPTRKPTNAPLESIPMSAPTGFPTNTPTKMATNIPSLAHDVATTVSDEISTNTMELSEIVSTTSDVGIINTDDNDLNSFVSILEDNYVYILIGVGAFVCCILMCCVVFVCLYCKRDKQMKRVLEELGHEQRDVELMDVQTGGATQQTRSKRPHLSSKSKNKYEKFTD